MLYDFRIIGQWKVKVAIAMKPHGQQQYETLIHAEANVMNLGAMYQFYPPYAFFNPIALRKAKVAYNFGLSECNRASIFCKIVPFVLSLQTIKFSDLDKFSNFPL